MLALAECARPTQGRANLVIATLLCLMWPALRAGAQAPPPAPAPAPAPAPPPEIATGDAQAFTYLSTVKVTQQSNAVSISLAAEGTIRLDLDSDFYNQFYASGSGQGAQQVCFRLGNCRARLASFIPISLYPVDHLEIGVPRETMNGVGLDVTVVLDTRARLNSGGTTGSGVGISIQQPPDRRSVLVTVTSDQRPERKPVRKPESEAEGPDSMKVAWQDGRLDLVASNQPLRELAREISRVSGTRVVVADGADRLVSAVIHDRRAEDAIALLCDAYGLTFSARQGVLVLTDGSEPGNAEGEVTELPLRYLDAARVQSLLPTFLTHFLHVDATRNAVVISGGPSLRARLASDLNVLDQPAPQCRVSATFAAYTDEGSFTRALDLARRTSGSSVSLSTNADNGTPGLMVYSKASADTPGIDATLTALQTDQDLQLNVKPSLILLNSRRGTVFDGQTYYMVFNAIQGGGLQRIDVGSSLSATPSIGSDNWITLRLSLQASNVGSLDPLTRLPIVESRRLYSTLRIRSGDTVYIGGLEQYQKHVNCYKVPILGDIPLLGALFRWRSDSTQEVRIGVFATATLIADKASS